MVPENKQNRRYKQINFIGLQNNRHPSQTMLATFIKLLETVSKSLFRNRSQNGCHTFMEGEHFADVEAIQESVTADSAIDS
jgi:hypothetical protein